MVMHLVPPHLSRLAVRLGGLLVLALALGGCETIAITALGIGASAGVTHTVNGTSARTFTAPEAKVKAASLAALGRMGAAVESIDRVENGELIRARSADRSIEVEIEPMSRTTTHVRASAKRSFFVYDGATAKEIIVQTELALLPAAPAAAPAKRGGKMLTSVPGGAAAPRTANARPL
jgi:lipoprotein-anchoring transpeptidase ErfK/SrfK